MELERALAELRPAVLRHCYRMMGSLAEAEDLTQETFERAWTARAGFKHDSSVKRWVFAIATNACLNALTARRRRELPSEALPSTSLELLEDEHSRWLGPASDERLFPPSSETLERRETVTLAFLALLQRLPPSQRAVLLLKDVVGLSAEEIAHELELTVPAVNSALHRARTGVQQPKERADEPSPETVRAFVSAWERRDLDALTRLLRDSCTLVMPPYATWFSGRPMLEAFFRSPRFQTFWNSLAEVVPTRVNGQPGFRFIREVNGQKSLHSVMVARFENGLAAELVVFLDRTVFAGPMVS